MSQTYDPACRRIADLLAAAIRRGDHAEGARLLELWDKLTTDPASVSVDSLKPMDGGNQSHLA